jgi:hypothetical protein
MITWPAGWALGDERKIRGVARRRGSAAKLLSAGMVQGPSMATVGTLAAFQERLSRLEQ